MNNKQELIVPENKNIRLNETSVKFDAKIGTKDLIEAVVFETEENLLNNKGALEDSIAKLNDGCNKLQEKITKSTTECINKYKDKEVEDLSTRISKITGKKTIVKYDGHVNKDKLYLSIFIVEANNRYSDNISLTIEKTLALPKEIATLKTNHDKLHKAYLDSHKLLTEVDKQVKELPRIKKRVNAAFVKTLLKDNNMSGEDMLDALRAELLKIK